MKKILVFSILVITIVIAFGCQPAEPFAYSGDYADLYTEAIHSVLGVIGKDRIPEVGWINPSIKVLEEDSYGRKIFTYYERALNNQYAFLVSQKSENGLVYYYPDYNFVIGEKDWSEPQDATTEQEGYTYYYWGYNYRAKVSEAQLLELKEKNDWNKEINLEKCIKQTVAQIKEDPLEKKEKESLYEELFGAKDNHCDLYIDYLTKDDDGKMLFCARKVDGEPTDYRMLIVDGDTHYCQKINNPTAYQEELAEFKREHNWKQS